MNNFDESVQGASPIYIGLAPCTDLTHFAAHQVTNLCKSWVSVKTLCLEKKH